MKLIVMGVHITSGFLSFEKALSLSPMSIKKL